MLGSTPKQLSEAHHQDGQPRSRLDIVSMCYTQRIWYVNLTKSKQLNSGTVLFVDSYEDARRHLGEAESKSDIDLTDIEQQPMGRGHRKKSANTRYSP